jgi:ABC-type Mn2+/Zn2+ transport system ATPase subunit
VTVVTENALFPPALEAKGVSLAIAGRPVLHDVSFRIERGDFLCICGSNGAGKTMFTKVLLGLIEPTLGSVSLGGLTPKAGRRKTGYVPQRKNFDRLFPAKVVEVIAAHLEGAWPLFVRETTRDKAAAALRLVGAEQHIDKELRELSGGELQRAFLARALAAEPDLLVLDEPMAGVDAKGIHDMTALLDHLVRQRGMTVVMVTHSLTVVERCASKILFMQDGHVRAFGPPAELLQDEHIREGAFTGHDHEHAITSGRGDY